MQEQVLTYLKNNREKLLKKLNEFLSIPSVSTDSTSKESVEQAANFVKQYEHDIGSKKIEKIETGGHPVIYAHYDGAGENAPTVVFYGHDDVQPVDTLKEW